MLGLIQYLECAKMLQFKRQCNSVTCIHCIMNLCTLDEYEIYERMFLEED